MEFASARITLRVSVYYASIQVAEMRKIQGT